MKKLLAVLMIIMSTFISCESIKTNKKVKVIKTDNYTVEQKKKVQDVEYLCDRLHNNHGNIYKNVSKKDFDKEKERIISEIPKLSEFEFFIELNHLVSFIHDNNARAEMSYELNQKLHGIPLEFARFDDGYYVIGAMDEKYLGDKVIKINGMNMDKISDKFKYFINYENKQSFNRKACSNMNCVEILKFFKIIDDESKVNVTLEKDGVTKQVLFQTKTAKDLQEGGKTIKCKPMKYKQYDNHSYSTKIIDENNYYIKYSRCVEDNDLKISSLTSNIKKDCRENNFKSIIVDFRLNGMSGDDKVGDNTLFLPVVQCIQELSKKGIKIYGLIGEDTCGPVMTNAVQLKKYTGCVFVGQPTYGNVNEFVNEHGVIVLPNSRIYILYSNKYIENDKTYKSDSLYPDVSVKHTFKDWVEGKDKEMDYLLNIK